MGKAHLSLKSRAAPPAWLTSHPAKPVFGTESDKHPTRSAQNKQKGVHRLYDLRRESEGVCKRRRDG